MGVGFTFLIIQWNTHGAVNEVLVQGTCDYIDMIHDDNLINSN